MKTWVITYFNGCSHEMIVNAVTYDEVAQFAKSTFPASYIWHIEEIS